MKVERVAAARKYAVKELILNMTNPDFRIAFYLLLLLWLPLPSSLAQNKLGEVDGRRARAI